METRILVLAILGISAAFTMFLAVLGAVSQHEIRRILSVHVISQVGYMVFGIAVMTGYALAGCVFYMIQHMVVKSSLFLCCGVIEKHTGTDDLDGLGGVLKRDAWLGVLFFIAAMSLVGLPPLSGFFGKLVIIESGWAPEPWYLPVLSILGLATGALTLLSMMKIWSYAFWSPATAPTAMEAGAVKRSSKSAYLGIVMLVGSALFLGFGAQPVYQVVFNAGEQLANPKHYIQAVLGDEAASSYRAPGSDKEQSTIAAGAGEHKLASGGRSKDHPALEDGLTDPLAAQARPWQSAMPSGLLARQMRFDALSDSPGRAIETKEVAR
jgi:multicomponent Na+:H+ antiporter subunit D